MKTITPIRQKWPGTMTDRERFRAQMHYQPFDRTFNMEFGYWDENYLQWKLFTENGVTNESEANRFFSFDRIETTGGNVWLDPPFESVEISRTERTKTVLNSDGLWTEVALDGHSSIPHCFKSSVETPDDWKRVKEERFRLRSPGRRIDAEAIKARYPKDRDFPAGVNVGSMIGKIRDMLTFEGLCYAQYDYPEMLDDMVETCCVMVEDALDQLLPLTDFDYAAGWEDICFKNGPIVTPDFFRDVVTPRYKRINAKLKAHGIDIWYCDCDGDIRPILDSFLDGGVNCMFPYEVNGCMHPKDLLDQYGKRLRIMGGIDKMQLKAGKDAIKAYLKSVEPLVERGGYIPFCDHRCPPDVAEDDYMYYLDLKQRMFGGI
ncbi:MAG: hypothetical protein LBH66_04280 [Oscillospiraceae bacterium]|jgi:uroporphyrinogen decarboxylase|nr:hypothetical protein [Oscillospiraceae bacterium]